MDKQHKAARRIPDVETLAVAMNTAQLQPDEFRLGRDLTVPAARIFAALPAEPTELAEALDVDLAAMRGVERMLSVYLGPSRAADAANDVIAKLRLSGFDIVRLIPSEPRADSEGLREAIERIHRHRDGCNGHPHRRWYRGENKCESLARAALRREQPAAEPWPRWECSSCRRSHDQCDRSIDVQGVACCNDCDHEQPAAEGERDA